MGGKVSVVEQKFGSQPDNSFMLIPVWSVMSLSDDKGENAWVWVSLPLNLVLLTFPEIVLWMFSYDFPFVAIYVD